MIFHSRLQDDPEAQSIVAPYYFCALFSILLSASLGATILYFRAPFSAPGLFSVLQCVLIVVSVTMAQPFFVSALLAVPLINGIQAARVGCSKLVDISRFIYAYGYASYAEHQGPPILSDDDLCKKAKTLGSAGYSC